MARIRIPRDTLFLQDLILQRTGPFISMGGNNVLAETMNSGNKALLVSFLEKNKLTERYVNETLFELNEEANYIKKFIPRDSMSNIISIGPGNGILELLLVVNKEINSLTLIDIESNERLYHGWRETGSGYASLERTKRLLVTNGVNEEKIMLVNPTKDPVPEIKASLLISLLSMGFHYPCGIYRDLLINGMGPNPYIIFDKRDYVEDRAFEELLEVSEIIHSVQFKKHKRLFLRRNA